MTDLFHLEIKSESLVVQTFLRLNQIKLSADHYAANYTHSVVLPDTTELLVRTQPVDRSIDTEKLKTVEFNGVQISLTDYITIGVQFAEMWRAEDDAAKPFVPGDGGPVVAVPAVP